MVVLSLGLPRTICMQASHADVRYPHMARNGGRNKQINVNMPPRSLYVMSGDAFLKWKHGVKAVDKPKGVALPWWNPYGEARVVVYRSTKVYSNAVFPPKINAA